MVKMYLLFVLKYPVGWIMHYVVQGTVARHLYTIFFGLLIQSWMFGSDMLHVALMSVGVYAMMKFMKRDSQHKYVMAWVMIYLSYLHLHFMKFGSYDNNINVTINLMLLVSRLSSLGFCYKDGG